MDWIAREGCDATEGSQVFSALQRAQSPYESHVDLTKTGWVGPAMMASLAAFVDSKSRAGIAIKFSGPENTDVRYYLSRMGLASVLDERGVTHDLPEVNANPALSQKALVEVAAFSSEEDVAALVAIVQHQAIAPELKRTVCQALLEAGCNVPEHARVERGFMAAQVLNNGTTLHLAVADAGVGVFATLGGVGAKFERQALLMAASGTSESGEDDRGRGITSVHRSIKEHGGRGSLISGQSLVSLSPRGLHGWTGTTPGFRGTILDVVLPIT